MTSLPVAASADDRTSGVTPDTGAATVSVSDILDRAVVLEWHESVAIVAGLCTALAAERATKAPALHDIVLTSDGTVVIKGTARKGDLVTLPRLLHELLVMTTAPMPLRVLLLQAISSEVNRSPAAFGESLAYYERPGREALILAARQRCLGTPTTTVEAGAPTATERFEREAIAEASAGASAPTRPHRARIAIAATIMCGAAVAVVMTTSALPGSVSVDVARSLQAAAATLGDKSQKVVDAVASEMGIAFEADDPASQPGTTPDAPAPTKSEKRTPAMRISTNVPDPQGIQTVLEPTAAAAVAPALAPSISQPIAATMADLSGLGTPEVPTRTERSVTAPLIPPRLIDPVRLPGWAQPTGTAALNTIELDITEAGAVERVRFVSPTVRMTDMMILSAAKTWIFEPAFENGRPVPYRLTLNWVGPDR